MVTRGALRSGERLPSVRRLSEERGVSVATVLAAYLLLEGRGVAEARPKSGHYVRARRADDPPVPNIPRRAPSPARVSIAAGADDLIRAMVQDRGLVPLGTAYVAAELLPLRKLNAALAAVAREGVGPGGAYDELRGNLQLRRQLAHRAVAWGAFLEADDFVTTVGATEALNLSLRAVTKPGDIIAVESPAYFGLLRLVDVHGLRADRDPQRPAHRSRPRRARRRDPQRARPRRARDAQLLEPARRSHARREQGAAREDARRAATSRSSRTTSTATSRSTARARGPPRRSTPRATCSCAARSRRRSRPAIASGGSRPGKYRDAVEKLKFAHTVSSPTPTQMAVAEFLAGGGYDRHVRRLRRVLAAQSERYREAIARHFPEGTRVSRPQGGFVVWVELNPRVSARRTSSSARSIAGSRSPPGTIFSARQRFGHFVRISTGHPWSPRIEQAIATLGQLARA